MQCILNPKTRKHLYRARHKVQLISHPHMTPESPCSNKTPPSEIDMGRNRSYAVASIYICVCVCVCVCNSVTTKCIDFVYFWSVCDGLSHTLLNIFFSQLICFISSNQFNFWKVWLTPTNAQFYNLCILSITYLIHVSAWLPSSGSLHQNLCLIYV